MASNGCPRPRCFGDRTMYWILKMIAIAGAFGSGMYTTYKLMWDRGDVRWAIIYLYLTFFALSILTAEFELIKNPTIRRFSLFLTTYAGRALFYIFMGGLMLDSWGFIPGIWMIGAGALNIATMFLCSEQLAPSEMNAGVQGDADPHQRI